MNQFRLNLLTLFFCLTIVLFSSCGRPVKFENDTLKTGDLVFFGIPANYSSEEGSMAEAISDATGIDSLNLIHVAIAEVEKDSVWIIDATIKHGTHRHPLDTTLKDFTLRDGSYPVFIIKRLPDTCDVIGAVERAKKFIGQPYDVYFLPENGAMYCSELVRESFLDSKGNHLFPSQPMNFKNKDGEFPAYWVKLFESLGQPIPQDTPGTNPQDMSNFPLLRPVDVDITTLQTKANL